MDKLIFLIIESFKNLWRHKGTAFTSIITVCLTMIILGMFLIINDNSNKLAEIFRSKYKLEVFFKDGITEQNAKNIISNIKTNSIVRQVKFINKDEALDIYQDEFGENAIEMLGYNPFPMSNVIYLSKKNFSSEKIDGLLEQLKNTNEVSSIYYQGNLVSRLESIFNIIVGSVKILVAVALIISIIFITNTIKLTIYSRSELVRTLKLIGATNTFVKTPFILEGIFQSLIGTGIACGLLILMAAEINGILGEWLSLHLSVNIFMPIYLMIISITIGLVASLKAVSKFL
ncbi:MAG: hypothetical protein CMG69_04470 [Candidatus Marinimicrobia bacterium]|nr:hypothetical protein [Candidatus Neomarinimicrobiota bacterium]|tara:strand:+ start:51087 stop:51950 length:864 start_codon:yes stop_codon:yes gene_type:complete